MVALHRWVGLASCLGVVLLLAGCGSGPKLYPASGKATLGDQPAKGFKIDLISSDSKIPSAYQSASGQTADDGSFKLTSGPDGKSGAAVGKYMVRATKIQAAGDAEAAMKSGGAGNVPVQYKCEPAEVDITTSGNTSLSIKISEPGAAEAPAGS